MKNRLGEMSREELLKLQVGVDKALKEADNRDRRQARAAAEQAAAQYGYQLRDLVSSSKRGGLPPKYRNPEDPSQTWSGRGRKPKWMHGAIAKGRDMSELEI